MEGPSALTVAVAPWLGWARDGRRRASLRRPPQRLYTCDDLMQGRRRGGNRGFAPGAPARCTSAFRNAAQNADEPSGGGPTAFLDTQHFCEQTGLYPALARARRSASASPTS